MKSALVLAVALAMAMPVVSVPTVADAQVLTRRSTPVRRPRPAPPRLTEVEETQLVEAQSAIETLDGQVAEVRAAGETQGALTTEQQAWLDGQAARRTELEAVVTRLEAKKSR